MVLYLYKISVKVEKPARNVLVALIRMLPCTTSSTETMVWNGFSKLRDELQKYSLCRTADLREGGGTPMPRIDLDLTFCTHRLARCTFRQTQMDTETC